MDSGNYEGGNHIAIFHERTRPPKEPLAENEQTIFRSELGKLMRIARIARPCAIYDDSDAAQTFSDGELLEQGVGILENEERKFRQVKRNRILNTFLALPNLWESDRRMVIK